MAQSITKSVGKSGVNLRGDVMIVQDLLNRAGYGILMVDGLCGLKTNDAIKRFQLQQFGPAGADGRVDPNGRTLGRLNDFQNREPSLTTSSVLLCPHGGSVKCVPVGPPPVPPVAGGTPLKRTDPGVVTGCPLPTPCVRVQWVPGMTLTLDASSLGLCLSAASVPQGSVVIAKV